MKLRLFTLFVVLAFGVIVAPVMAETFSDAGNTCTTDPKDDSGLPECGTRHDNECYPGGVLYREENQDGCKTEWYWKAGWYLAQFNDGKLSRENFPKEFESVLPPLPPKEEVVVLPCNVNVPGHGNVLVPTAVLARTPASIIPNTYNDGALIWAWHNGALGDDLGIFSFGDTHVYHLGTGWLFPTTGNCVVNEP